MDNFQSDHKKKLIEKEWVDLNIKIKKHNYLYHGLDQPEISDLEYDKIKLRLINLEKEYSFLENPRLPEDVKSDAVIIKNGSTEGVKFPMTDKTLKAALGSDKYKDVKLLKFDNILDIFDGKAIYEDEIDNSKFFERVRHLTAIWCCVRPPEKGVPGHIWYDIWFDVIPHQDRHMRMITKEWVPDNNMLGP